MNRKLKYILPNLFSFFYLLRYSIRKYKLQTISGIIFSKDRPIQLDALLTSYYMYCIDPCTITVLYNTSDDFFENAYSDLKLIHNKVSFVRENNFRNDLISLLKNIEEEFVFFAVDDMVFIRKFTLSTIIKKMKFQTIFSMRLGNRINWCETCQVTMNPNFSVLGNFIEWKWSNNNFDWGYRFSVDGNVFKTMEVLSLTESLDFKAPNSYEGLMNGFFLFKLKKKGISFSDPVVVNLVLNKIQLESEYNNLFGDISVYGLLEYWNQGYKFDIKKIAECNFNSVHKIMNEVPLVKFK